jgi:guanine nucleotide-binding protein alpha-1 subunit
MAHAQAAPQSLSSEDSLPQLNPELWMIKMRLAPLQQLEQILARRLAPLDSREKEPGQLDLSYAEPSKNVLRELAVNSTVQWKNAVSRLLKSESDREDVDCEQAVECGDPNDPGLVLHACVADMAQLWGDPTIHQLLEKQNIRLEEMAGL